MAEVVIDGAAVSDEAELHCLLAEKLCFPKWYGKNLDALYDCLTSLESPCRLTVAHADSLRKTLGERAEAFFCVLHDAAAESEKLTITMK